MYETYLRYYVGVPHRLQIPVSWKRSMFLVISLVVNVDLNGTAKCRIKMPLIKSVFLS